MAAEICSQIPACSVRIGHHFADHFEVIPVLPPKGTGGGKVCFFTRGNIQETKGARICEIHFWYIFGLQGMICFRYPLNPDFARFAVEHGWY